MGDFNLKTECEQEKKNIQFIFENYEIYIQNPTVQRGSRVSSLDHILVRRNFEKKFKCSSFKNIYSDHSAISFRQNIYISLYLL